MNSQISKEDLDKPLSPLEERVVRIEQRLDRHDKALSHITQALELIHEWARGAQGWIERYQGSNHFNDTEGKVNE